MNKNLKHIPIFFSVDDGYIPFLAVTLKSLLLHANSCNFYDIKILHASSVNKENQQIILEMNQSENIAIEFVDITGYVEKINNRLHTRDYYSKSTYYRLFIPNLYPELNKALYLDADILIRDDVAKLYATNLGNNLIGAIPDGAIQQVQEFRDYSENRIGVEHYSKYINAGILVMNLKALRFHHFEETFLDLLSKVTYTVAQDQDYINVICRNRITYVNEIWNAMPIHYIIKGIGPKIVHYNLDYKPWRIDGIMYSEEFWEVAKQTPFYETILNIKNSYTQEDIDKSEKETINLMAKAKAEALDSITNEQISMEIDSFLFAKGY